MNDSPLNIDLLQAVLDEYRDKLNRFAELLVTENQKYNLTRVDSLEQIQTRHFLDSLAGLSVLESQAERPLTILDIGSGAGFPGLVLAIARPQWKIVSLEATAKKVNFQGMVCDALDLENVTVINNRAESLAHDAQYRETFDAVTARALASLPVLAELSLAFLKLRGAALYWKGPSEDPETAQGAIKTLGAQLEDLFSYSLPGEGTESSKMLLLKCKKIKPTPEQYPRVFGIIKKKPLS
jgi:16S rRNA (guanine527-N7)-methyltransferase